MQFANVQCQMTIKYYNFDLLLSLDMFLRSRAVQVKLLLYLLNLAITTMIMLAFIFLLSYPNLCP
jgi:hypothetical protein